MCSNDSACEATFLVSIKPEENAQVSWTSCHGKACLVIRRRCFQPVHQHVLSTRRCDIQEHNVRLAVAGDLVRVPTSSTRHTFLKEQRKTQHGNTG
jgi:hypothetical protein